MNIFYSILFMLLIQVCERRPGVPGPPIPRLLVTFFILFIFFFPSDRPTQYQETHSTLNERKKGDGLRSLRLKTARSSLTMGQFFMKRAKEANIIATRISLDVGFRELKNAL